MIPVDHGVFHRMLWQKADRQHAVYIDQLALREELQMSKFAISKMIRTFVEDGRITQVNNRPQLKGRFIVHNPYLWARERGLVK
jgi:biotin operon repressor